MNCAPILGFGTWCIVSASRRRSTSTGSTRAPSGGVLIGTTVSPLSRPERLGDGDMGPLIVDLRFWIFDWHLILC